MHGEFNTHLVLGKGEREGGEKTKVLKLKYQPGI
jgi:hypothetical protein